jgi:hypothetical protein
MKKISTIALLLCLAVPALAAQHGGMSMPSAQDAMGAAAPAAGAHKGVEIRKATVEGYAVRYELIDMAAMMAGKQMPGHDMGAMKSHHLMAFLAGADGKPVEGAKVGYLVTGPDKAEQKVLAMYMMGGYGADVDLKAKGKYTILTKAEIAGKTVKDEFVYEVK